MTYTYHVPSSVLGLEGEKKKKKVQEGLSPALKSSQSCRRDKIRT